VNLDWFLFSAQIAPKGTGEFESELREAVAAMKEVYDLTEGAHYRELLRSVDGAGSGSSG
jgi:hypothetical protein